MKKIILIAAFSLLGFTAFAQSNPPAGYPLVNGVVKRIDMANKQITLKHDDIPNLNMPGMTMPFSVESEHILHGLKVGDQVKFAADQNADGDLVIFWINKVQPATIDNANTVSCTGIYGENPKVKIDVAVRLKQDKYSTIRYEFADGSYKGTAYINSIGDMALKRHHNSFAFSSGDSELSTKLNFDLTGKSQIENAEFYKYSAAGKFIPVDCRFEVL